MGFYQFKRQDAFDFASFINARTSIHGDELIFRVCPYCHGDNKTDQKKFAINLNSGAFNCLRSSCGAKGSFWTLAKDFNFSLPGVDEYYGYETKKYRTFKIEHIESKDEAVKYCKSRGISEEICRKYELTVQKDHPNILVFPFRDEKGVVDMIKYRDTEYTEEKKKAGANKEWSEKDGKAILFGMNHCNYTVDTLVLCEGQLDSLSVATAGIPNALSVPTGCMGKTWIPHCWDFVKKFKTLVVFGDNEKGKITLVDMVKGRFSDMLIKVVRFEDYGGCKDANEILQTYGEEAVRKAVENAQPIPIASAVEIADVADVNLLSMPAMKTGIDELDSVLTRGLYFGQVILLTGNRGDGKSTFMNQIVCNAVDKGVKTFLYSGEMPNHVIKNYCKTMWAGKHESEISDDLAKRIFEYYRGRLFLYDSSAIENDETEDILKIAEQTIVQYGCELICLDNLMTIVEADSNDSLYRVQSKFVGRLMKLAKQYNVIVILVAHPRKTSRTDVRADFSNDDVSGSADITNKVDVVMSYQRCRKKKGEDEPDESLRDLWITKNRLTGKLAVGDNAIRLQYDKASRRITGIRQTFTPKDFNYRYVESMGIKLMPEDTDDSSDWEDIDYANANLPF